MVQGHQKRLQRRVGAYLQILHPRTLIVCLCLTYQVLSVGPKESMKQTEPPSIPVAKLFPDGIFPEGERQPYTEEYATMP